MAVEIALKNVSKSFTTKKLGTVTAVDNFNLEINEGECFAFLGPSGCGKTTTLRMIAGFEDLSEGEIYLSGKPVSIKSQKKYIPPEDRGLGMVFQAFAVWPHMNVFENVAFPLRVLKKSNDEIKEKVSLALKHTNLLGLEKVYPSDLSGGQQQRIALARAIVTNPRVMLLDEPLSNLDPHLRESMRFEIKELQKKFNFTIIFVTHDQSEAMALSDRMLVMDMGKIVQIGTPQELYNKPINKFVHSFLGESSFIQVNYDEKNSTLCIDGASEILNLQLNEEQKTLAKKKGNRLLMAIRPNMVEINKTSGIKGEIIKRVFLTNFIEYLVKIGTQFIKVQTPHRINFKDGDPCYLSFPEVMWYEFEDENADKERTRRQLL